jgi:hypothetical protein
MKNPNQQWNEYLNSKTIRPKTFTVTFERNRSGNYRVIGRGASMLNVVNQYKADWVPVDVRDLTSALRNAEVTVS